MRIFGIRLEILVLGILLDLSGLAYVHVIFLELVRLACHGGLVALDARSFQNDSIHRDVHTCLDFEDISHLYVVVVNRLLNSFSDRNDLIGKFNKKSCHLIIRN